MKSYGHLWKQITDEENLRRAWHDVRRGHSDSREVIDYERALDANLFALRDELLSGGYQPSGYRQFQILDPKPRTISCAPVRDRIVHHALCNVITPLLEASFIHNTFACREGKGAHRAASLARRYCGEFGYYLKLDVRHYFDSIEHGRLLAVLSKKFREREVQRLIEAIVKCPLKGQSAGRGLPIGNLTSQWFANVFLDAFDHLAQTGFGLGEVRYIRYMDDFVFFADSKELLWKILGRVRDWLGEERGLELKGEATRVAPVTEGLSFLGLRIFPGCWRFRRERFVRTRKTFRGRLRQFEAGAIDERRFAGCAASSDGSLRWYGFKNILVDLASGQGASSGSNRVQRGGNWNWNNNNCTSGNRNNNNPSNRNNNYGFRLTSTLPGHCQGPARGAGASRRAKTNMRAFGRPVAIATASPGLLISEGVL